MLNKTTFLVAGVPHNSTAKKEPVELLGTKSAAQQIRSSLINSAIQMLSLDNLQEISSYLQSEDDSTATDEAEAAENIGALAEAAKNIGAFAEAIDEMGIISALNAEQLIELAFNDKPKIFSDGSVHVPPRMIKAQKNARERLLAIIPSITYREPQVLMDILGDDLNCDSHDDSLKQAAIEQWKSIQPSFTQD